MYVYWDKTCKCRVVHTALEYEGIGTTNCREGNLGWSTCISESKPPDLWSIAIGHSNFDIMVLPAHIDRSAKIYLRQRTKTFRHKIDTRYSWRAEVDSETTCIEYPKDKSWFMNLESLHIACSRYLHWRIRMCEYSIRKVQADRRWIQPGSTDRSTIWHTARVSVFRSDRRV